MHNMSEYKELYHYDDKRSLVMNEVTGDVRMMKRLTHFDEDVYAYLSSHRDDHVPLIYDYWKEDETLIVIEEVVQGNTFDIVINDRTMPDKEKLKLFVELLEGLRFLHSADKPIIHRDLKPSNIMVTEKGEVKILDYDAAKIYKADSTGDTTNLGTAGIAAPEQYGFMQSDPRSDVYAVGKMLADAFPGNKKIQKIAAKASSFDPADRYANAGELSDVLTGRISPGLILKPLFPPPGFRTRKWWKILIAMFAYPFMLFIIFGVTSEKSTMAENVETKIIFALMLFGVLDIWTSWTGLFDVMPFINHDNIFLRCLSKLVFSAVWLVLMCVILMFIEGLLSLYVPK